jgi:thioredoxin-like negative regulator of GroEL
VGFNNRTNADAVRCARVRRRGGGGECDGKMVRGAHVVVRAGETTTTTTTTRDEEEQCGDGRSGRRGVVVGSASLAALAAAAMTTWGAGEARAAGDAVLELTPENFEREVVKTPGAVFVEFYAPWCPYCKRLEPIWSELPSKLEAAGSKTRVARMNVDTYTDYASAYAVTGFPTLMLFENGRPVGAKTGLIDMTTAMRYAGVKDESVLSQFAPEKKLDKILSGPQIDYVQAELGEVRKELAGLEPESRARALEALQQVEAIVGVRSL